MRIQFNTCLKERDWIITVLFLFNQDFYVYLVTSKRTPAQKEEITNSTSKDKVTRKSNV